MSHASLPQTVPVQYGHHVGPILAVTLHICVSNSCEHLSHLKRTTLPECSATVCNMSLDMMTHASFLVSVHEAKLRIQQSLHSSLPHSFFPAQYGHHTDFRGSVILYNIDSNSWGHLSHLNRIILQECSATVCRVSAGIMTHASFRVSDHEAKLRTMQWVHSGLPHNF